MVVLLVNRQKYHLKNFNFCNQQRPCKKYWFPCWGARQVPRSQCPFELDHVEAQQLFRIASQESKLLYLQDELGSPQGLPSPAAKRVFEQRLWVWRPLSLADFQQLWIVGYFITTTKQPSLAKLNAAWRMDYCTSLWGRACDQGRRFDGAVDCGSVALDIAPRCGQARPAC